MSKKIASPAILTGKLLEDALKTKERKKKKERKEEDVCSNKLEI
jgi:hypothetical protein